jgi:hypothetical protein
MRLEHPKQPDALPISAQNVQLLFSYGVINMISHFIVGYICMGIGIHIGYFLFDEYSIEKYDKLKRY